MERLVNQLIELEWEFFQETQNIGGRADCQDNYDMFYVMRRSQWMTLPYEVIQSIRNDDLVAKQSGRNPIAEKYAYMMSSYAKEDYDKIKDSLPAISTEKMDIIEEIVTIYMRWYEELVPSYPKFMQNGRNLRTSSDSYCGVSIETYLRSELMTYSCHSNRLWLDFASNCVNNHINLVKQTYDFTAHGYGYESIDLLEQHLQH